ncbi:hypothetical protein HDC94_001066 [Leifsonia sp. AK011]|nr:hypothetical protein [Leifsonia sp. AK011]
MTDQHTDLARTALTEITRAETIGEPLGEVTEDDGTITVRFASALAGYPGWAWTVSLAEVEGEAATVLEAELMPGDGALLAPDWVPWSERLADYKAAQEALEADATDSDVDGDSEDDDLDDDESDEELDEDDVLGNDVLHGGDLDGVDIDALEGDDDDTDDADDDSDDSDDEGAERTY